jgi:hypothetical protein
MLRPLVFAVIVAACGGTPAKVERIENQPEPQTKTLPPPPAEPPPPITAESLTAAQLLVEGQIVAITGYAGTFQTGPLGVEATNETSQHFQAVGEAEPFDLAVRLWKFDGDRAAALAHYDYLASMLPSVTRTDEIATRSLRAAEGDIVGVAFLDEPRAMVVLLTCGNQQCSDVEMAVALARLAHRRIAD